MIKFTTKKVPYTLFEQRHRPYLEVLFLNNVLLKSSSKTLALMDTGADSNLIPYSLGKAIGLEKPKPEEFKDIGGVGGSISYIVRPCRICIIDPQNKRMYCFDEIIYWAYPNLEIQKYLEMLLKEHNESASFQEEAKIETRLYNYFDSQRKQRFLEIKKTMDKFENSSLLGRPFFNNFCFAFLD